MTAKILLIEDDHDILDIISYVLSDEGFQVISSTASDILKDILSIQPDIIFLDEWLMGDERGSNHCKKLKADPATSHIPVVLLSAQNPIESIAAKAGADDFIPKPFDINALGDAVRKHLKLKA